MEISIREYKPSDYEQCEELVNEAWHFDKLFADKNLCGIALRMYTKGGLCHSNINLVAVQQGKVVGFLFGLNILSKAKARGKIRLALDAIISFNFKKMDRKERDRFIEILTDHNKNRAAIESGNESEVCLFVISQELRGKGIGTKLWEKFRDSCVECGVSKIRVETNKLGASSFYEKLGFELTSNFDSPLHELATPNGQACMYEWKR